MQEFDKRKFEKWLQQQLEINLYNRMTDTHIDPIGAYYDGELKPGGVDLSFENLANKELSGKDLPFACLDEADLSYANLCGSFLAGASLIGTNLTGTNLSNANLKLAKILPVSFSGLNLKGADLLGAHLELNGDRIWSNEDIHGAFFNFASVDGDGLFDSSSILPNGERYDSNFP